MADDSRNYLKLAGYLIAIGASAIVLNYLYQHIVTEWNKQSSTASQSLSKRLK